MDDDVLISVNDQDPVVIEITETTIGTYPVIVQLTDAPIIATNAATGNTFLISSNGDRTLAIPTQPVAGLRRVWRWKNNGVVSHTLTLDTALGGFRVDSQSNAFFIVGVGKTLYLGAIYNQEDNYWDVVAYRSGF